MSEENKFDFDSSEEREPQSHQSETPPDDSNSIFADIMGALGVRDSPHRQRKGGNEKKKAPPKRIQTHCLNLKWMCGILSGLRVRK